MNKDSFFSWGKVGQGEKRDKGEKGEKGEKRLPRITIDNTSGAMSEMTKAPFSAA